MLNKFLLALAGAFMLSAPAAATEDWTMSQVAENPAAWREAPADNLVLMKTTKGDIVIELAADMAPRHVERIREIVRNGYYDGTKFHRVINGFMAQGGDISTVRPNVQLEPLAGEFTYRRDPEDQAMTVLNPEFVNQPYYAGYIFGFPVATKQDRMADYTMDGRVESWIPHCAGIVSMARTSDPNSATDQFFLMRDETSTLDRNYTPWGRMIDGAEIAKAMNVGEPPVQPDLVVTARLVSDLPPSLRPRAYVMRNDSAEFKALIEGSRDAETVCKAPSTPAVVQYP